MKKVLLIDAFGLIFRSYYAFINRPLTNKSGKNTSAIFGFFKTILAILKKENPDYYLVALEGLGECFRNEIYPEYKAHRPPAPEDLVYQIPRIITLIDDLGIPTLSKDTYEADDIIGSVAKQLPKKDLVINIITSDKDMRQLIDDHIFVYHPSKIDNDFNIYDKTTIIEKMGIKATQMIDYLALVGDSSDNIPGVKGIGPKSAESLLKDWESLEGIYKNIDKIASKGLVTKLKDSEENAFLSYKLAKIKIDIPLDINLENFKIKPFLMDTAEKELMEDNLKTLVDSLKDFNKSVFKETGEANLFETPDKSEKKEIKEENRNLTNEKETLKSKGIEYPVVFELDKIKEKVKKIIELKVFCFDLETTGFDFVQDKIISINIAYEGDAFIIPINISKNQEQEINFEMSESHIKNILEILRPVFENDSILLIGHNIKFDIKFLKNIGFNVTENIFDTMIAEYCLDASFNIFNMDDLAEKYLNYLTIHYEDVVKDTKNSNLQNVPIKELADYAGEDADVTFQLYKVLKTELAKDQKLNDLFYKIEIPIINVLINMEMTGVRIDKTYLNDLSKQFEIEITNINEKLMTIAGEDFNPNSPKQISEILFTKLKLPVFKKTKTGPSTDVQVLTKLSYIHPIASLLLEHRSLTKLKSTYSDSLPLMINSKTDKIHTTFLQTGTQTGRVASKDPNLQNIPIKTDIGRKIRSAFIPEKGHILLSADYSQIELFLLAELSRDPNLYSAFKNNEDIHNKTASLIFDKAMDKVEKQERIVGKTINFSILYGQGPFRLSENLNITRQEASNFINVYFTKYAGIAAYMELIREECRTKGYVETIWGRRRTIPEILDRNKMRQADGERMAVNTKIQGSAADLIKLAMIKIFNSIKKKKLKSQLIIQVHDELIFNVVENEKDEISSIIKEAMEKGFDFSLELKTSIQLGKNWGELH